MKKFIPAILILFLTAGLSISFFAQTKKPVKKNQKPVAPATIETTPTPAKTVEPEPAKTPTKKNERPVNGNSTNGNSLKSETEPDYFYEFTQPAFVISKIHIEHDDSGKGKISFVKSISDEEITDPIQLSPAAMERIKTSLTALDFFNSTENYQYEKDYSHLGNIKIKVKRDGRERETKFNWTQNADARALADEYRKLSNQYIWMFDINLARENQPLTAPRLMDTLDSYIRRNEVSDATQMIPFLKELSEDERIPLIARNHAARLVKEIEKKNEKK